MFKSRQLDNINVQSNKSESEVSYKFQTSSHSFFFFIVNNVLQSNLDIKKG